MSQPNNFLQEFQQNLDKLVKINDIVDKNIQDRKNFTSVVVTKLGEINQAVKTLSDKIKALKTLADQLQVQVTSNSTDIGEKQNQINSLQSQIQDLTRQRDELAEQLKQLQQKCTQDTANLQQQINTMEAQIQKLTADNQSLQERVNTLSEELKNTGELGAKSAADLKSQSDAFNSQIAQIVDENNKKIDDLTKNIEAKDQQINQLQADLQKAQQDTQNHTETLTQMQNQAATASADLQKQLDGLKAKNDDLIGRLKAANTAIVNALQSLDRLSDEAVNQENMQNVNVAFAEVEKSLMEINAAIQGAASTATETVSTGAETSTVRPRIANDTLITMQQIGGPPFQITYDDLISQIRDKARLGGSQGEKYRNALTALQNVTNPNDIPTILNKYINLKNNQVFGGKKSKSKSKTKKNKTKKNKTKKQKGGFHYKPLSRRKSLLTSFRKN